MSQSKYSVDLLRSNYAEPAAQAMPKTTTGSVTKISAAQPAKLDISTFLIGAVAGAFITLLFIYGVAPAAFQYGAAKIREKTPR